MVIGYAQLGTSCYDYFFLGIHDSITRRYDSASTYAQQMGRLKSAKENSDPGGFLAKTTYLKTLTDSNHFDIINDPMLNKFEK